MTMGRNGSEISNPTRTENEVLELLMQKSPVTLRKAASYSLLGIIPVLMGLRQ